MSLIFCFFLLYRYTFSCASENESLAYFRPISFYLYGFLVIYYLEFGAGFPYYIKNYGLESVILLDLSILYFLIFLFFGFERRITKIDLLIRRKFSVDIALTAIEKIALVIFVTGLLFWYLIITSSGGLLKWASESRGAVNWELISGYYLTLTWLLPFGLLLLYHSSELLKRTFIYRLFIFGLLFSTLIFYLYLGSRSGVLIIGGGFLIVKSFSTGRIRFLFYLTFGALLIYFASNFIAAFRGGFYNLSFDLSGFSENEILLYTLGVLKPGFLLNERDIASELNISFLTLEYFPSKISHNYGYEFLQLFTNVVPSSIWPEKPYPRGESWSEFYSLTSLSNWYVSWVANPFYAGPAPGAIATWYASSGFIGLPLGGFVTGYYLKLLDNFFILTRKYQSNFLFFLIISPSLFFDSVQHPFQFVYNSVVVFVVVYLAYKFFPSRRFEFRR